MKKNKCLPRARLPGTGIPFKRSRLAVAVSAATMLSGPIVEAQQTLEEIIVTAQRREQSVFDVPYNISVLSGDAIRNVGAANVDDVLRMIPGLAFDNGGTKQQLNNSMILRGVNFQSPGFTNSFQNLSDAPVSMYVGEIPVFSVIKMTDIDRVEVLRGPQGTLYGSGSVGGTVKFHFNKPDLENQVFEASGRFGGNSHSDELNYSADFIGNLPVSDNFAIRVSAGYEELGGVTDANGRYALEANKDPASTGPVTSEVMGELPPVPVFSQPVLADPSNPDSPALVEPVDDIDDFETWYIRGSALLKISENAEVLASWYHQEDDGFGDTASAVINNDPNDNMEWEHNLRRGSEDLNYTTDIGALEITVDMGFATVTSATGYTNIDKDYTNDISGLYDRLDGLDFGAFTGFGSYGGFPRLTTPSPQVLDEFETFTEEIRLVTDTGGRWDVVLGFYYEDTRQDVGGYDLWPGYFEWINDPTTAVAQTYGTPTVADALAATSNTGLGYPFTLFRKVDFEEKAVFGEVTIRLTDKWQVTGGARVFWQDFEQLLFNQLPVCGLFCSITGDPINGTAADEATSADFQDEIFKVNTSYDIMENHKMYFTWAEGFRHGGANPFATTGGGAVQEDFVLFESDKATNWEVGLKGTLMDNRMRYSMAGYFIQWDNPQTDGFFGPFALPAVINAEEAETVGFEVEVTATPTDNLLVTFGYNYVDAEFSKDATALAGLSGTYATIADGDPLPGVPESIASWSIDYFYPLDNGSEIHANVNGNVRSSVTTFPNTNFRDYAKIDGFSIWNASIEWRTDKVSIGAFVNNIGDEVAVTGARIFQAEFDDRATIGRPRSFGVFANYSFN